MNTDIEDLPASTRRRIVALQQRLVRIQSQCIVTRNSLDLHGRRCSVLDVAIRTVGAYKDSPSFAAWRSLVARLWHRLRRKVGWPEISGLKYLSREMGDFETRLKRQGACVEWGMSEDVFLCACAFAREEDDQWQSLFNEDGIDCGLADVHESVAPSVPDFGCRDVSDAMEFAWEFFVEKCPLEPLNGESSEKRRSLAAVGTEERRGERRIRVSRIPRFASTSLSVFDLCGGSSGQGRKSKIPLAPTMRRKRASISAIPLTPPKISECRNFSPKKNRFFDASRSHIPRPNRESSLRRSILSSSDSSND